MQISLLTSGFPNGFTQDFIHCVKQYYSNKGSIIFIASDFAGHDRTDHYTAILSNMFQAEGILFKEIFVVDDRVTSETAIQYIKRASVIWLSGGDTLKQIDHLQQYNLIPSLQGKQGLIIGMSAGAINMAKKVVLAKDEDDFIPELSVYEGIGLVDINIEPHIDSSSQKHLDEDLKEASKFAKIYGLPDESFIKVIDDEIEIFGDYKIFESSAEESL